jgi:phytoene dehydrogenase-like protein
MARKSMIIIGAGIAGLSAGCYAQMSGYETRIFELHDKPGGCCTSWKRKGYTFDYCIHNLSGTSQGSKFYRIWEELGAFDGISRLGFHELVELDAADGRRVKISADLDKLKENLLAVSPQDFKVIDEYVVAAKKARGVDFTSIFLGGWMSTIVLLPKIGLVRKWGPITAGKFAERFQDPFLRRAMAVVQYGMSEVPMIVHLSMLAALERGEMGWPVGGSMAFSRNIERRYTALGGKVGYRSRVAKIVVEDGHAKGVVLEDGTEHRADIIISAADGRSTIYDMLGGKYLNDRIRSYYESSVPERQEFGLEVFLGVARDLSSEPHAIALFLDSPIEVEGAPVERLDVELFSSDKGVAPEGKGAIKVVFASSYDYWKRLNRDKIAYGKEKERLTTEVIDRLEPRFPGLLAQVEAVDVMTPLTVERYLGAYRGMQAWPPKLDMSTLMKEDVSTTLPGLKDFHMVGQFAQGMVGLSTAAAGGRKLVQRLCKEDGRKFQAMSK